MYSSTWQRTRKDWQANGKHFIGDVRIPCSFVFFTGRTRAITTQFTRNYYGNPVQSFCRKAGWQHKMASIGYGYNCMSSLQHRPHSVTAKFMVPTIVGIHALCKCMVVSVTFEFTNWLQLRFWSSSSLLVFFSFTLSGFKLFLTGGFVGFNSCSSATGSIIRWRNPTVATIRRKSVCHPVCVSRARL